LKKVRFKIFIALVFFTVVSADASDFTGNILMGYGQLQSPDMKNATSTELRKGGIQVFFQGLWGDGQLKYGAETGIMEAYVNWDNDGRFISKDSLVVVPLNAIIQYDFCDSDAKSVPFVFAGAGGNFPVESRSSENNSSSSSKMYTGAVAGLGVQFKISNETNLTASTRYSYINSPDNVTLAGINIGISRKLAFTKEEKPFELKHGKSRSEKNK
jgi:hypothetical protein